MIGPLARWWRRRREQAALRRRPIPDDLWKRTLVRYPFLRRHDAAAAAELLQEEITLTEEVFELANWLRARGCIILCLSDKPDEASMPHPRVSPDLAPLHRAETHRVGVSIAAELNAIG